MRRFPRIARARATLALPGVVSASAIGPSSARQRSFRVFPVARRRGWRRGRTAWQVVSRCEAPWELGGGRARPGERRAGVRRKRDVVWWRPMRRRMRPAEGSCPPISVRRPLRLSRVSLCRGLPGEERLAHRACAVASCAPEACRNSPEPVAPTQPRRLEEWVTGRRTESPSRGRRAKTRLVDAATGFWRFGPEAPAAATPAQRGLCVGGRGRGWLAGSSRRSTGKVHSARCAQATGRHLGLGWRSGQTPPDRAVVERA